MIEIAVVGSLNLDTTAQVTRLPQPGETVLVSAGLQSADIDNFTHTISIHGVEYDIRDRAIVLVFDPSAWASASDVGPEFTVSVYAFDACSVCGSPRHRVAASEAASRISFFVYLYSGAT